MNFLPPVLRVAIPAPLRHSFDYYAPADYDPALLQAGVRVRVPFGKKERIGLVLSVQTQSNLSPDQIKTALEIIDTTPLLSPNIFSLLSWASDYYQHPIGEVIFSSLPQAIARGQVIENPPHPPFSKEGTNVSPFEKEGSGGILNTAQQHAVQQLITQQGFKPFLLHGVTGSGKTEVYLQTIARVLATGQQALVLVPEIGLTPQTVQRFAERFAVPISILHSGLTPKQKLHAWLNARNGHARIIIGTRSAIFTPLAQPGIIILDEEHDPSFKQNSSLRYSARDVAVVRARLENIPVVLGTATPALETIYNVQRKRFDYLGLPERVGQHAKPPHVQIIDLRQQKLHGGLSDRLLQEINNHTQQGSQVLLFLNRRGYAPNLLCHACGSSANCSRCDARLTLHQFPTRLVCHHCSGEQPPITQCPHCQQANLFPVGMGTERLEETLKTHFSTVPIQRIDRDTTRRKGNLENSLATIQRGEPCILIGTQMLAKGHHFPNVTLVAIIDADTGLYSQDFRATERLGQLITQVAGRAGRGEKIGSVYLQTHCPEHPLLQHLLHQDYSTLANTLLNERQTAHWPPYAFLALLRAEATQAKAPLQFLQQVKQSIVTLCKNNSIEILGPVPALMERKAGRFRAQLLFKSSSRTKLQKYLPRLIQTINALKSSRHVRWSLDVDPSELD